MNCPSCQHPNRSSARFCSECGAKLQPICPQCGAETAPAAKFCDACGAALAAAAAASPPESPSPPPSLEAEFVAFQQALPTSLRDQLLTSGEGENRLVTVLFADMSRSLETTRSMHPEEVATMVNRLLNAMLDALVKYEGRIDKLLGDGVLAVFGAPHAHEDDPERAVRAALAIREAARELGLEVTAGINTGEVYVGGMGSDRHQEVTVMGPVVHLASRFQQHAEPGQILVGEATHRLTRRAFAFAPHSLAIKGLAEQVTAYEVERALPRPEKVRGIEGLRAELIGRDEEFARLQEALDELLHGRGQIVTLIGDAGVGKSRLVAELKAAPGSWLLAPGQDDDNRSGVRAQAPPSQEPRARSQERPLWLEGRCLELGMTAGYWLFVDLFREFFAWRPEEDDLVRGERLAACLREFVTRGDLTEERCDEIGPLLGNLLSVRFGTDWDDRLTHASPEQIKHQTFLALRDFFVALARQRPVVLVLEDLHWADNLSLDVISLLMEVLTLAPLLLLCVYRPEKEHRCWRLGTIAAQKCAGRATEIQLRELTPQQSRRLVESLLRIDSLPAAVKEQILEKARGNPFFVEEVVRSLIDTGQVYRDGDVWRAREEISSLTVPESIQSVILSRVDRLERETRHVLESASVVGRLFRRRLLERLTRQAAALEQSLGQLEDRELIYQERVVPEEEYSFQHVLTQETVYQSILRRRRAVFHQQVAEAMELLYEEGLEEYAEQLAYHYERSSADEKAIEYLLKAGEKARRAYLNEEATSYFQRALDRLDRLTTNDQRPTTDDQRPTTTVGAGPRARPPDPRARPHRETGAWRLEAHNGLGRIALGLGHVTEAESHFREAIALGREIGLETPALVRLYYWLGDALFWQSRYEEMLSLAQEGLALLGEDQESVEAALMNTTLAVAYNNTGDWQKGDAMHRRNAEFLEGLPYSEELSPVYTQIVRVMLYSDPTDVEEGQRWLRILERKAEEHHDLRALGEVQYWSADFRASLGDVLGSRAHHQRARERFAKIGDTKFESWCLTCLGYDALHLGDLQTAEECFLQAHGRLENVGNTRDIAFSYRNLGLIHFCKGALEEARDTFRKAERLYQELHGYWAADAAFPLGRTSLALGQREEALQHFEKVLSTDLGVPGLTLALGGLEEAYEDPEAFRAFCRRYREEHPEVESRRPAHWFLEPAVVYPFRNVTGHDDFAEALSPEWVWHDPLGDCCFEIANGLEIHAAAGRDLFASNMSAPRLLRPIAGEFAVQIVCLAVSPQKPTVGGLLLWKDSRRFLRLEWGNHGQYEVTFERRLPDSHIIVGRGRLPGERVFLRLERLGTRVNALCSLDGENWFSVGEVEFPVEEPLEVGFHALSGNLETLFFRGICPKDGTAIRFESFRIWA
jgi:class 3 adenylate cyclase/tetratricopeptide (TPR) repeat protein